LNPPGEPPFPSPLTLVDVAGGLLACEGILAALYARERTGHGSKVETSLLSAAMWLQSPSLRCVAADIRAGRTVDRRPVTCYDQPLATNDGFLVIDDRDCRMSSMVEDLGQLHRRSAREWERLLLDAGVAAAAVRTELRTLPSDSRFAELVVGVHEGCCFLPAPPWRFTATI
jgi:CoA:oxalate CoA-transferase